MPPAEQGKEVSVGLHTIYQELHDDLGCQGGWHNGWRNAPAAASRLLPCVVRPPTLIHLLRSACARQP